MTYVALARRYRPQTFAEVVAQSHITDTLRLAIAGGRTASAYLFTGSRGSGKTSVARIVAKAVNCDHPKDGEPDGTCESCVSITEGRSLDVLEIDGASNNSVDDVRELRENVGYAASKPGKRKVYIVDEVHMLSTGAFNALLKTLEEPPPHVLFVFATTDPRKVPLTIVSRCQRFDFRRLQTGEILDRLQFICKKEKIEIEPAALFLLAKRAEGSLRDGLSLLDQVVSSSSGRIQATQVAELLGLVRTEAYLEITQAVLDRDARRALEIVHAALQQGIDANDFVLGLVEHQRNLLLLRIDPALAASVQLGEPHLEQAKELAARFKPEDLLHLMNRAAQLYEELKRSPQPALGLEAAMVEMTRFESRVVLAELLERLEGGPPAGPGPRGAAPGSGGRTASPGPAPAPASGRRSPSTRAEAEIVPLPLGALPPATPATPPTAHDESVAARLTPPTATIPAATLAEPSGERSLFAAGGPPPAPHPRPAPRPAGTAIGAAATLDFEAVCARWAEFTTALRDSKAILAHCLSEGQPVRLAAGTLEIWFPPEHSFHMHAVQEAIRQRELDPYLSTYFGHTLKLSVTVEATRLETATGPAGRITPDDIARSRRGAIEDVVQQSPGVDDIIQAFDGEVLDGPQS